MRQIFVLVKMVIMQSFVIVFSQPLKDEFNYLSIFLNVFISFMYTMGCETSGHIISLGNHILNCNVQVLEGCSARNDYFMYPLDSWRRRKRRMHKKNQVIA